MRYKSSAHAIIVVTVLFLGTSTLIVDAQVPVCDDALAERADVEVDNLKTWEEIYAWFKRYSACNEGAPAEGYSEAVVRMLADRWNQLSTLQTLVKHDERFGNFVIQHIDATTDDADLARVLTNASQQCPRSDEPLCDTIRRRAVDARAQLHEMLRPPEEH